MSDKYFILEEWCGVYSEKQILKPKLGTWRFSGLFKEFKDSLSCIEYLLGMHYTEGHYDNEILNIKKIEEFKRNGYFLERKSYPYKIRVFEWELDD